MASLNGPKAWGLHRTRRRAPVIVNASSDEEGKGGENDRPSFNPFGTWNQIEKEVGVSQSPYGRALYRVALLKESPHGRAT